MRRRRKQTARGGPRNDGLVASLVESGVKGRWAYGHPELD